MLKYDEIEDKDEYKKIFEKVDKEVKEILEKNNIQVGLGYTHLYDECKKKILKEKYNIDWKTTEEMNTGVIID